MRVLFSIAILLLATASHGQQVPQYTQNVFNYFSINPAVAGSKDCVDVRLGFRKQWVGFENAPTTGWASVHATIRNKKKPYVTGKHGIGGAVEADDTGPLGYTLVHLAYAYHIRLNRGYYMALGLFAGVKQQKFDVGRVTLADYNDPVLNSKGSTFVVPMIAPGMWVYSNTWWLGLSVHQLLNNRMTGIGIDSRTTGHYFLSGGYRWRIGKKTSVTPSSLIKLSPGAPLAFDVNAMIEWDRKLGFGVSYRNQDAIALMIKLGFLKFFSLGYSYDITTSPLRVASSNTHEFILGITPCIPVDPSKRIVRCPIFE